MNTVQVIRNNLVNLFQRETVLTMNIIKETLGTTSKATMFRKLKPMGYRASYSHAGKFYTLDEIANYNKYGIWSFDQIHFSRHGTLVNTLENIINKSKDGYFASELQALVHVRVFNALTQLVSSVRIAREQIAGEHLYISIMTGTGQVKRRKQSIMESVSSKRKVSVPGFSNEAVSECLQTFLSVLDEKQTRLYLGLESMKLGHGGDHKIYRLTGVNIKTIARGRRELTSKNITPERIRKIGAGRPSIKKKRSCEAVRRIDGE